MASATDGSDVRNSTYVRSMMEMNNVQLKSRVRELTDEVEHLRNAKNRMYTETQEYIAFATHEMKAKDDTIAQLRSKLHDIEFNKESEVRNLQQQMQDAYDTTVTQHRLVEADLRDKLRVAENKLERSQQFLERRDEMETKIRELQATLEAERDATRQALQDLERKYLIEKNELAKQHQAHFFELRRQARVEAQRMLDSDTKRIIFENKQMGEELKLQSEETKVLQKERLTTAEQARVLAREVEIYADKEKEWARQGSRKTQENRALKSRIVELEDELRAAREELESLRASLTEQFYKDTESMRLELQGVKSLLVLKTKELQTLKRLSSIILQQRTEVEQFFLDALTEVKLEIARKRKAARAMSTYIGRSTVEKLGASIQPHTPGSTSRTAHSTTLHVGSQRLAPSSASTTPRRTGLVATPLRTAASEVVGFGADATPAAATTAEDEDATLREARRVTLAELQPEDRERVLRILFAKINSFKPPPPEETTEKRRRDSTIDIVEEISTEFVNLSEEPTMVGAPFGLSADVPRSVLDGEFKRDSRPQSGLRGSAATPKATRSSIEGGITARMQATVRSTVPNQRPSSSAVSAALLGSLAAGDDTPADKLADTTVLADQLSRKISDRNNLVAKLHHG